MANPNMDTSMILDPSESQLGQDIFARICCGDVGVVADIGCRSPSFFSNSAPLIELGWRGVGIDLEPDLELWSKYPQMDISMADARFFDWSKLQLNVDYLSVDVDEASVLSLANFFASINGGVPSCATIETDRYKLGAGPMFAINQIMGELGYVLVGNNLWNFENWYLHENHPKINQVATALTPWGDEDNNDIEGIGRFKQFLKDLQVELG